MVRIDDNIRTAMREEVREEVRDELKREEKIRRRRHCLGCLTVYAIVLGVPFVFGAVTVARTGLYDVPLLTGWLYEPKTVEREVNPLIGRGSDVVWREVAASGKYHLETGQADLSMTEVELTTIIAESIAMTEGLPFEVERPQVAVDRDGLELYFVTPRGDRQVPVIIDLVPKIKGGVLSFEIERMTLGGAELPSLLSSSFAKLVNNVLGRQFSDNLPDGMVLRKVETTSDRRLKISIGVLD